LRAGALSDRYRPASVPLREEARRERTRHPDDLAPERDLAAPVGVSPHPGQLPAAVLGSIGQQLTNRAAGELPREPNLVDLILGGAVIPSHVLIVARRDRSEACRGTSRPLASRGSTKHTTPPRIGSANRASGSGTYRLGVGRLGCGYLAERLGDLRGQLDLLDGERPTQLRRGSGTHDRRG